ncbi:unnamed protein product [Brachionus calyciflorus]|uniref:Uncharacterized protein n=1 Tax=Brachionus calyciflorus TaxID=104777 RepID=A0A813T4H7_9BILA|nr:unnamed protein product [Brachionus calyciflorus]
MNQAYHFLRSEGSPTIENPIKMYVNLKIDEDLMNSIRQQIMSDLLSQCLNGRNQCPIGSKFAQLHCFYNWVLWCSKECENGEMHVCVVIGWNRLWVVHSKFN